MYLALGVQGLNAVERALMRGENKGELNRCKGLGEDFRQIVRFEICSTRSEHKTLIYKVKKIAGKKVSAVILIPCMTAEEMVNWMGSYHLCLRSFSVCVRKIETERQSRSHCQALVTVMIVFCAPWHPGHSTEPSRTPEEFLPQGQVSLAVKWFSVSPSQCQNHREVDFSVYQWLLFMSFSIITSSIAWLLTFTPVAFFGWCHSFFMKSFINDIHRTSVQGYLCFFLIRLISHAFLLCVCDSPFSPSVMIDGPFVQSRELTQAPAEAAVLFCQRFFFLFRFWKIVSD